MADLTELSDEELQARLVAEEQAVRMSLRVPVGYGGLGMINREVAVDFANATRRELLRRGRDDLVQ